MKNQMGEKRKERSDKKKQLRPSLPGVLVAEVHALKKFLHAPSLSSVLERLLTLSITDKEFVEYIKPYLYRSTKLPVSSDAIYYVTLLANPYNKMSAKDLYLEIKEGMTERVSFFVTKQTTELYLQPLASGLNLSYDGLAAVALDYAINHLTDKIAPGYTCKYYARNRVRSRGLS